MYSITHDWHKIPDSNDVGYTPATRLFGGVDSGSICGASRLKATHMTYGRTRTCRKSAPIELDMSGKGSVKQLDINLIDTVHEFERYWISHQFLRSHSEDQVTAYMSRLVRSCLLVNRCNRRQECCSRSAGWQIQHSRYFPPSCVRRSLLDKIDMNTRDCQSRAQSVAVVLLGIWVFDFVLQLQCDGD